MVQTPIKPLTLEEFLKLPETKPAREFINGEIIQKPMPQGKHSTVQSDFISAANTILKPQHIARAYSELRCTFGGRSIVPDIAVFTWERPAMKMVKLLILLLSLLTGQLKYFLLNKVKLK